jgi:thiol:disulfide interchange protein
LLDADSAVASAYNLLGVPTYVFVDKEGNARFTSHTFPEKEYKQIMSE